MTVSNDEFLTLNWKNFYAYHHRYLQLITVILTQVILKSSCALPACTNNLIPS